MGTITPFMAFKKKYFNKKPRSKVILSPTKLSNLSNLGIFGASFAKPLIDF